MGASLLQSRLYGALIAPALCIAAAGVFVERNAMTDGLLREWAKSLTILLAGLLASIFLVRAWATAYVAKAPSFVWYSKSVAASGCVSTQGLEIEMHRITLPLQNKGCYAFSATTTNLDGDATLYVVRQPVPPRWSHELHQIVDLTFVAHHRGGVVTTLRKKISADEIAVSVTLPATVGGLVALDVLVPADGEINGKVSLAYFHDNKKVISNVVEK